MDVIYVYDPVVILIDQPHVLVHSHQLYKKQTTAGTIFHVVNARRQYFIFDFTAAAAFDRFAFTQYCIYIYIHIHTHIYIYIYIEI